MFCTGMPRSKPIQLQPSNGLALAPRAPKPGNAEPFLSAFLRNSLGRWHLPCRGSARGANNSRY